MNWQMFWQQLDLAGRIYCAFLGMAALWVIGYIFISLVVPAIKYFFRRPPAPDKNHPKKVQVSFGDGYITLERRWSFIKSKWEYVLVGELPYRATSPDEEWEQLRKTMKSNRCALDSSPGLEEEKPQGPIQPAEPRQYDFSEVEKMRF